MMSDSKEPRHWDLDEGDFSIYYFDDDGHPVMVTGEMAEPMSEELAREMVAKLNQPDAAHGARPIKEPTK
jgi:hypothetical protein